MLLTFFKIYKKRMILKYKDYINEGVDANLTVPDLAWLYLLAYSYKDYHQKIDSWKRDRRMSNVAEESLKKFQDIGIMHLKDGKMIFTKRALDIVDDKFGAKTAEEAMSKSYALSEWAGNKGYHIHMIPVDYYEESHESLAENLSKIDDLKVDWYNRQKETTITKIKKTPGIKDHNKLELFRYFYPNKIPTILTVYRGIQEEYSEKREGRDAYSSWSLNREQGVRFAKYIFTGGMQFHPIYADKQYLLEAKVSVDDVVLFYPEQGEAEIVLHNPVKNVKVTNIKNI